MLTLLLNPSIRSVLIGAAIAFAVLIGYAFWSNHLKEVGAAQEQAKEQAIAIQHEQKVDAEATAIDQEVAKDKNPQDTLSKEWSQQ